MNKQIEAFRSPPDPDRDARSAARPAKPVQPGFDGALDDALDDVMARFARALEHLAR